jgi:hypothetical protein
LGTAQPPKKSIVRRKKRCKKGTYTPCTKSTVMVFSHGEDEAIREHTEPMYFFSIAF